MADENSRVEFTVTGVDNACTSGFDDITLNGSEHFIFKSWIDDSGQSLYLSHGEISWSGRAADGTQYVGSDKFHSAGRFDGSVASTVQDNSTLLVSQGSDPNFLTRYKVATTVDVSTGEATFTLIKDIDQCRT